MISLCIQKVQLLHDMTDEEYPIQDQIYIYIYIYIFEWCERVYILGEYL